jgi:hypothetical protein
MAARLRAALKRFSIFIPRQGATGGAEKCLPIPYNSRNVCDIIEKFCGSGVYFDVF